MTDKKVIISMVGRLDFTGAYKPQEASKSIKQAFYGNSRLEAIDDSKSCIENPRRQILSQVSSRFLELACLIRSRKRIKKAKNRSP